MTEFIVAEISKNWERTVIDDRKLISEAFEEAIEVNLHRGYTLHQFQLHRIMTGPDSMNETIIAVFKKID